MKPFMLIFVLVFSTPLFAYDFFNPKCPRTPHLKVSDYLNSADSIEENGFTTLQTDLNGSHKNVLFLVTPKSTFKGIVKNEDIIFEIENLVALGFNIYWREVTSWDEILRYIESFDIKFDMIVMNAHGSPERMFFSSTKNIKDDLTIGSKIPGDLLMDKLKSNASVVLWSCLTGRMLNDGLNIAQILAQSLKGIRVYAPQEPTQNLQLKLNADGVLYPLFVSHFVEISCDEFLNSLEASTACVFAFIVFKPYFNNFLRGPSLFSYMNEEGVLISEPVEADDTYRKTYKRSIDYLRKLASTTP